MDMTEIFANVQSTGWWIGVVVVGILVSIIGNFLTRMLDSRLRTTFSWWDNRRKATDLKYKSDLDLLFSDPGQENILLSHETRSRLKAIESLIFFISTFFTLLILSAFFITPKWLTLIMMIFSIISWILYNYFWRGARRSESLLKDYYLSASTPKGKKNEMKSE